MSYGNPQSEFAAPTDLFAAAAAADERSGFITKTYAYLAGAVFALAALEIVLFHIPGIENLVSLMFVNRYSWLVVMGLFIAVSWIANAWAESSTSSGMQHAGLALYVVAESIILFPILFICAHNPSLGLETIATAAAATFALFALLTAVVFVTRKDFSFLKAFLMFGGIAALGFIVVAILFNFHLGVIFAYAMVAFSCCYILYDTSNIMHHYRIGQHVAASLALFASVALLFWYILRIFMSSRD